MDVVFLINSVFPHDSGGRTTWLRNVGVRLVARGHRVSVLAIQPAPAARAANALDESVRVVEVRVPLWLRVMEVVCRGPLSEVHRLLVAWPFRRHLRRTVAELGSPVVVTLDTVVTPLAIPPMQRSVRGFVCAVKGPHAELMGKRCKPLRWLFRCLERRALAHATEVWSNGWDTEQLIKDKGFPNIMIGNGIDAKAWECQCEEPMEYRVAQGAFRIVSIATVLPIKGVREAIEALARCAAAHTGDRSWRLMWVGRGSASRYLALATRYNVEELVEFVGERRDVRPYAQHAHVLLCLSGGCGMSMAALESMASGVPVIAWDTPVYRQLMKSGHSGILVREGDTDGLAGAIRQVSLLTPGQRAEMVANAKRAAVLQDWSVVVSRIETRLSCLQNKVFLDPKIA